MGLKLVRIGRSLAVALPHGTLCLIRQQYQIALEPVSLLRARSER